MRFAQRFWLASGVLIALALLQGCAMSHGAPSQALLVPASHLPYGAGLPVEHREVRVSAQVSGSPRPWVERRLAADQQESAAYQYAPTVSGAGQIGFGVTRVMSVFAGAEVARGRRAATADPFALPLHDHATTAAWGVGLRTSPPLRREWIDVAMLIDADMTVSGQTLSRCYLRVAERNGDVADLGDGYRAYCGRNAAYRRGVVRLRPTLGGQVGVRPWPALHVWAGAWATGTPQTSHGRRAGCVPFGFDGAMGPVCVRLADAQDEPYEVSNGHGPRDRGGIIMTPIAVGAAGFDVASRRVVVGAAILSPGFDRTPPYVVARVGVRSYWQKRHPRRLRAAPPDPERFPEPGSFSPAAP